MEAYKRDVQSREKKEKEEMRQKTEKYDRFKTNHVNSYFFNINGLNIPLRRYPQVA